ncbi:MAG: heavy metal translocating P-type ATPase [Halobacteriales archaeon]
MANEATGCSLCALPTPEPPVTGEGVTGTFCCRGCLEVARTLDDVETADAATARDALEEGPSVAGADGEEAFFAVDGMHCATCEAFIEGTAIDTLGIEAVEASYPSGMVRMIYDPAVIAESELPAVIDGLGYHARDLDEGRGEERQIALGRLLVGGFFGMMIMVWYILFLYPTYLGVDPQYLLLDVTGSAGWYLLGNIWVMSTVVLGYTGYPILRGAYVSLRSGHPNMDLLIALASVTAYSYSTLALVLGQTDVYFDVAVVIVLVVTIGNEYERRMKDRAASHLTELTDDRPTTARCRTEDGVESVPVEALEGGEEIIVNPGERVPIDGTIIEGTAAVDESLITGESVPVRKTPGDEAIGGAVVTDGALVLAVDPDTENTIDRLVHLLWGIQSAETGVQQLADRLAAVFVPVVIVLAIIATGWHFVDGATVIEALLTGLTVLVVSCPCALGLATPLAIAAGVRDSLDAGVVITDDSVFERASETGTIAFDKTGTLTTGTMQITEYHGSDELLTRAAAVEQFSDHPIARAVTSHTSPPTTEPVEFETYPGRGVGAIVDSERTLVGRPVLFESRGWSIPDAYRDTYEDARDRGALPALVGWEGYVHGVVVAADQPRPNWRSVLDSLSGDRRIIVITGDSQAAAARFREYSAIDEVFAGVPPEAKAAVVERLQADDTVAMVGDGSNDAPALGRADLGIAMESGTKLAADAADAIVTTDDLATVPMVFSLTEATHRRIRQNLGWAFLYNAIAIPLALAGLLNPLFAAIAMASSSLLVVGNSARSLDG